MQWLTIEDKVINLDNVAFFSKGDFNALTLIHTTHINFIGGQRITLEETNLIQLTDLVNQQTRNAVRFG